MTTSHVYHFSCNCVFQTVLEESVYDAVNDGSYDATFESVTKSRNRNKEKLAIG